MRYKITIEYDGTNFLGWQKQDDGPSIQQSIEEAIESFCQEKPRVYGAGRTDAGVHALAMVAHFDLKKPKATAKIQEALNFYLKKLPIVIKKVEKVDEEFHARFSAREKTYLYRILNRRQRPTIDKGRVWHVAKKLDIKNMKECAGVLVGHHDFSSFRSSICQAKSPVKTLDDIAIKKKGEYMEISFTARSFLHHQVRNMVGALMEAGSSKLSAEDMRKILKAKDRTKAPLKAPAEGLYFVKVLY